ncbi:TRAF3-interacting protein 1 isoform X4 [Nasonia vitripennis]|uniref:TRAF3-interacting protein 1 C-terminal domain-containing protein n=1 Tax=Nasonia vitripennis TaxID=7425 RepID=A0A7M7R4J1_NASVI|nr:TRAF3-interacting protein 1 isoform X4 [Nasonia vitripennis]
MLWNLRGRSKLSLTNNTNIESKSNLPISDSDKTLSYQPDSNLSTILSITNDPNTDPYIKNEDAHRNILGNNLVMSEYGFKKDDNFTISDIINKEVNNKINAKGVGLNQPEITSTKVINDRPFSARPAAPKHYTKYNEISDTNCIDAVKEIQIFNENLEDIVDHFATNGTITKNNLQHLNDSMFRGNEKKSFLFSQINKTHKELMNSENTETVPLSSIPITEENIAAKTETSRKEIGNLCICIQELIRSSNPLGKLIDFLQENIDMMYNEFQLWVYLNKSLKRHFDSKQISKINFVENIKKSLEDNNASARLEAQKIQQIKFDISKNNDKIGKLINECI